MKKSVLFVILALLLIGCAGLVACGGNDEGTQTQEPGKTTSASTKTTVASSGGLTWNDMPVYSGAKEIQKGSWSMPADEGDYSKVEWRYYEVSGSVADLVSYYKSKMSGNGWTETAWMEMGNTAWGMYNKNGEKDAAMVWVMAEDGKTILSMMRAAK